VFIKGIAATRHAALDEPQLERLKGISRKLL
jgi:hypothetical protein